MHDPMNPPAGGIPADPLPDDLPEGEAEEVDDVEVPEPVFDPYDIDWPSGIDRRIPPDLRIPPELERGLADANAGRVVPGVLRSDELDDQASSEFDDEQETDDDA